MLPIYEKQNREKEKVRAKRVAERFEWLQSQAQPPSCYGINIRQEPPPPKVAPFKAKPAPASTRRSLAQQLELEQAER
jgi:hypothetical protein